MRKIYSTLFVGALIMLANSTNVYANSIENNATIDFNENSAFYNMATTGSDGEVFIKDKPDQEAKPIATLDKGASVEILRKDDDWTRVKSGDIEGWVRTLDIITGYNMEAYILQNGEVFDRTAKITQGEVSISGDTPGDGKVLAIVKENDEVKVIEEYEDWLYVRADNVEGYIPKSSADVHTNFKPAEGYVEGDRGDVSSNGNNSGGGNYKNYVELPNDPNCSNGVTPDSETELRKGMVNYAMQFIGNPYVYGGTSMVNGVDCSAFVQNIYRNFGMSLPRTCREQVSLGREIPLEDIRPGDLLYYYDYDKGYVGHVTMYIGNNKVIHASNPKSGIIISNAWYRTPTSIRRMFDD